MRRPLGNPGSITAKVMKPLLVLALAFSAFFIAPAAASAAPAGGTSAEIKSGDIGINAVFNCQYFSRSPFQVINFTCRVTSGAIKVFVNCADGRTVSSAVMPAVGTYYVTLNCAPARVSTFRIQEIV